MKKVRIIVAIILIVLIGTKECFIAHADENDMRITSEGIMVRELSYAELMKISDEMSASAYGTSSMLPAATLSDYTAYEYSESFNFTLNGTWVARADASCIVWHYTDGKVHLYQRTITVTRLATYDASRTYGRIVNTDGSLSYTTGDRAHIYSLTNTWDFAIDFRVTPTEASFNCYEV